MLYEIEGLCFVNMQSKCIKKIVDLNAFLKSLRFRSQMQMQNNLTM